MREAGSCKKKMRITLFLFGFVTTNLLSAQSQLGPGDLHFLSFRTDAPVSFSFVIWSRLDPGSTLSFTDNGWAAQDSNSFTHQSEDVLEWVHTGSTPLLPGTVIGIGCSPAGAFATTGSVTGNLYDLSDQGDQLFAFHGRLDSLVLLAGIHFNGNGWESDRTDPHTSARPASIAMHAIGLTETDNAFYTGLRTGHSMAQYKHWITDQHNSWLLHNAGQIQRRLNTNGFILVDPALERPNIRMEEDELFIGRKASVASEVSFGKGSMQDEFQIWAHGRDLFWKGLEQPLEVSVLSAQGRLFYRGRIEPPSGEWSLPKGKGLILWRFLKLADGGDPLHVHTIRSVGN